jgi:orotidine-5'-phosphate decarboxylase
MESPHYADRLQAAIQQTDAPVVVGIDPLLDRFPDELQPNSNSCQAAADSLEAFGHAIIEAVAERVPAVKINIAFFEPYYEAGIAAYYRLVSAAHRRGLLVIGDIKRGDIGSTAKRYAAAHSEMPAFEDRDEDSIPDAVTLAGYLGVNAVQPFIDAARKTGRGLYVLVRPSDPGADQVHEFGPEGSRFYQHMANLVNEWGSAAENLSSSGLSLVGAVVAPKDAESTAALRRAMPHTPWLVPGYGAQGGTAEACRACFLDAGRGAIVNASRSVIYSFAQDTYREEFGTDWRACIRAAAERFAADIRAISSP